MHGQRIIITGVTGYIGNRFAYFIKKHYPSCQILGISRNQLKNDHRFEHCALDLTHSSDTLNVIHAFKPSYIFHLAGLVFSYDWKELHLGNIISTINLLEAVKKTDNKIKIIAAGSAAEYGRVSPECLPVSESYTGLPTSPYGMSKLWQTQICQYYHIAGIAVIVARIFNVLGFGSSTKLTSGYFFDQILKIDRAEQEPSIYVNNLQIKRDFIDIEDVCSALLALAKSGYPGDIYNICSGVSLSYETLLNLAIKKLRHPVSLIFEQQASQNTEVINIYGCNKKIMEDTSWKPLVKIEESINNALYQPLLNTIPSDRVI